MRLKLRSVCRRSFPGRRGPACFRGWGAAAALVATVLSSPCNAGLDSALKWVARNVDLVPEHHVDADLRWFFNKSTDYQRTHYFIESDICIEMLLLGVMRTGFFGTTFEVRPGMGQTPKNVVFDPMDISYAWRPFLEGRIRAATFQLGVDHRCFHNVDRLDQPPDGFTVIYWNKVFLSAQSPAYRYKGFWNPALADSRAFLDRFGWYGHLGYFARSFPGTKSSNVNFMNYNVNEFLLKARYRIARTRRFGASVHGLAQFGLWRNEEAAGETERGYWRFMLSPEGSIIHERHGWTFLFNFILDDIPPFEGRPRFSKNGLVEFGVRMYL